MLFFHRNKKIPTSRNYDGLEQGFSILPAQATEKTNNTNEFRWSVDLIEKLISIFISIFLSSIGYGILMVMIALRLEANVKNEILISVSTITQIGAGVIFSKFLPSFGQKNGLVKTICYGSYISALSALLLYKFIGFIPWLIVIYALGTSLFSMSVARNTIMINLSPPHIRAIIISIGTTLVALGNALGPLILNLLKTNDEFISFAIASSLYVISVFPLGCLKKIDSPLREQKQISVWRYIKNSPKIMFSGFSCSYAMSSCSAFSIIYGIDIGMDKAEASMLLSALLFGTMFYLLYGFLCNHFNRRLLMIISALLALVFTYQIYFFSNEKNIFTLFFLLFGSLSGMKLPTVVLINEKYKSSQRLAVNSAYTRVALTGNIFGLLTTGLSMNQFGHKGLWISVSGILTLFLLFCFINYASKILRKEVKLSDFSIFQKQKNDEPQEV